MPPSVSKAHEIEPPAAIVDTLPVKLITEVGLNRPIVVPSPNSPEKLLPQHLTLSLLTSAQECSRPVAICSAPLSSPITPTGVI
jgi:hypothetical protein